MSRLIMTIAIVFTCTLSAKETQAQQNLPSRVFGQYVPGCYKAGGEDIFYIAAEFRGAFNYQNAANNAQRLAQNYGKMRQTLKVINGKVEKVRLAHDRHLLLIVVNNTRRKMNWVAAAQNGPTQSRCIMKSGKNGGSHGWVVENWQTNGWTVRMQFGDDDQGNMAYSLYLPK